MNFRFKVLSNVVQKILEPWSHVPCYRLWLILQCSGLQSVVPGHVPYYLIYSSSQYKYTCCVLFVHPGYLSVYTSFSQNTSLHLNTCGISFGMQNQCMDVPLSPEKGCLGGVQDSVNFSWIIHTFPFLLTDSEHLVCEKRTVWLLNARETTVLWYMW